MSEREDKRSKQSTSMHPCSPPSPPLTHPSTLSCVRENRSGATAFLVRTTCNNSVVGDHFYTWQENMFLALSKHSPPTPALPTVLGTMVSHETTRLCLRKHPEGGPGKMPVEGKKKEKRTENLENCGEVQIRQSASGGSRRSSPPGTSESTRTSQVNPLRQKLKEVQRDHRSSRTGILESTINIFTYPSLNRLSGEVFFSVLSTICIGFIVVSLLLRPPLVPLFAGLCEVFFFLFEWTKKIDDFVDNVL